jgi:hypothetical protein
MILSWPDGIYPKSQSFYIRHKSTRFISAFTGQYEVLERDAARWVAEFTFELDNASARKMDAFIAKLKGKAGQVLVPDFRRLLPKPVTLSMDDYADEIGLTFFDDHYDFDDDSHNDGFLSTEESPPLGAEDNALFGGGFDAVLIFNDQVSLLTEAGLTLLADNVGIAFETDRGFLLTIEHGDALEIAVEEGYGLQAQNDDDLLVQVGGAFFEGEGRPKLINGSDRALQISGLRPFTKVISAGESISPAPGHAHLILQDVVTDIDGAASIAISPKLRTIVTEQPLALGGVTVLMRLSQEDAGDNRTLPPNRSSYTLSFEQILN